MVYILPLIYGLLSVLACLIFLLCSQLCSWGTIRELQEKVKELEAQLETGKGSSLGLRDRATTYLGLLELVTDFTPDEVAARN